MRASRKTSRESRRRPGPMPGFPNPYPIVDGPEEFRVDWIVPQILENSEERLRRYLVERRKALRPQSGESIEDAAIRIAKLGRRAVEATGAAWWSSRVLSYRKEPSKRRREIPSWEWNRRRE